MLKKQETFCLELGNRSDLGYCYCNWGLLAREQRDPETDREKLAVALDIFTELNMPRERDAVRAELEKTTGASQSHSKIPAGARLLRLQAAVVCIVD